MTGWSGSDVELREEMYECSQYNDKRRATLAQMEEIGWVLHSDTRKGGTVGFISAKEWRKKHRDEELIPTSALTKPFPR